MGNKFNALNFNVIVTEVGLENKTKSGFDLTGFVDANERQKAGIVVSFGELCPKKSDDTYTLEEGMTVIFDKAKSTPITVDGTTYQIVYYADIILTF